VPEQIDSPSLRAGYRAVRLTPTRFTFVLWNEDRPPFDDPAVRRALALAVDRSKLLAEVRHGLGRAIAAPPLAPPGAAPPLAPPGAAPPLVPDGPAPRFDLAAADAALTAAGLPRPESGGPRTRGGRPFRIGLLLPSGSREAQATAKQLGEALSKLGITVEPQLGDLAVLLGRLKRGMFEAALLEWSGDGAADLEPLVRGRGAQNFGRHRSAEVDRLLDQLREPGADRAALSAQLEHALADDPPALYLFAPDEVYLIARRLGEPRLLGGFPLLRELGPAGAAP
jgi:peptide/nickel transport system substrate-binding protein